MNAIKTLKPNKSNLEIIIGLQCFFLVVLILFRFQYEQFNSHAESLIYPFSCILCGMNVWSFWSWYILTKSLFNPYLLFLLSAFLFNGGQAILEVLYIHKSGNLTAWELSDQLPPLSSETILNTLFLVIIGLGALHLGALISLGTAKVKSSSCGSKITVLVSSKNSYLIGKRLLWIALFPALFILRDAVLIVLTSGYHSLYQQDFETSYSAAPSILADFLIPGSFFLLAGSKEKSKSRLTSVIVIVIYATIRFFLGQRNQAVMPLVSLAWIWHHLIRPIPKTFLLSIGSLILFIIFPLVATTRNTAGQDRLSISFLLETFSSIDNPIIATISEMGGSMLTISYTLEIVPKDREFQMGTDYLYALFTLIPNVFGKLHPTVARGLPNHWLTEQINPNIAYMSGSYGFSFIAEAYLNFGWIGAPIALGVIGFLIVKLTSWAVKFRDPAKMAMIASFLSFFLFYARAESATVVRPLIWYSLIPYLGVCLLNHSSSKRLTR
ncbi:oligosaccharide repeat unit polymerase [Fischerella thermalis CCMEE 5201]|jgi:oligosaccharide repeat unit polymerase|nr:oligosaccharide repeat unit polymerase [Fischerella thermalis CCMEE 5201]